MHFDGVVTGAATEHRSPESPALESHAVRKHPVR